MVHAATLYLLGIHEKIYHNGLCCRRPFQDGNSNLYCMMTSFKWFTPLWCSQSQMCYKGKIIIFYYLLLLLIFLNVQSLVAFTNFPDITNSRPVLFVKTMLDRYLSTAWVMMRYQMRFEIILCCILQPTYSQTRASCCVLRVVLPFMVYLLLLHCQHTYY